MKRYTVEITESALRDMSDLYDYIAYTLGPKINAGNQYDRTAQRTWSGVSKAGIVTQRRFEFNSYSYPVHGGGDGCKSMMP